MQTADVTRACDLHTKCEEGRREATAISAIDRCKPHAPNMPQAGGAIAPSAGCHTPADDRLAAAMSAIRTSRRLIRETVERMIKPIRFIDS